MSKMALNPDPNMSNGLVTHWQTQNTPCCHLEVPPSDWSPTFHVGLVKGS